MWEALGDAFRKYFVFVLLGACLLVIIAPPNYQTLSLLHYLIADCLAGLTSMFIFRFLEKDWQRAISFGIVGGGTLILVDLCYWLTKYSS